ncbi:LysE family translocator [Flexibacterium corallicola]|uniref:LysE family translocator n=1 Tax=Flexibacterium corallicola TaxID=3037259 RepID=UPI00286FADF0|nr:LysE family translocator [Pseudovibrio sp. M1P-2-3]
MDLSALLFFAATLLMAALTPGPGITALVVRVLGSGKRGALGFCLGMITGDMLWLSCAVLGLAALISSMAFAFTLMKYLGAAYLVYIAWKMWNSEAVVLNAGGEMQDKAMSSWASYVSGLLLTLGNPKVVVFYVALLPNIVPLEQISWVGYVELLAIVWSVLILVFSSYVLMGLRARRLITSPKVMKRVNKGAGVVMMGVAGTIVTR